MGNYLEHRFVLQKSETKPIRHSLQFLIDGEWKTVQEGIIEYYPLNGRLFYMPEVKDGLASMWYVRTVDNNICECIGKRYFDGAFYLNKLDNKCLVTFFTQDASFKTKEYEQVHIDYQRYLLICQIKEGLFDVYKILHYPDFIASCCLKIYFGTADQILHFDVLGGGRMYLKSCLASDKTLYWKQFDATPWYRKLLKKTKKSSRK